MAKQKPIPYQQMPLIKGGARYLYQAITDELRTRIGTSFYPRDERIPSVEELAAEFDVSTITVRRAIRDLSLEGLLVGRQGRGVFVADKNRIVRSIGLNRLSPIEVDMRAAGFEVGLHDLGMAVTTSDDEPFLAKVFPPQARLYRLDRLLLADGMAVSLDTIWLPRALAEKLNNHLKSQFIIPLLTEYNITIHHTKYQIEATTASERQASMLDMITGSSLLVIKFFPTDEEGRTILVGRNVSRADRFTYELESRNMMKSGISEDRSAT